MFLNFSATMHFSNWAPLIPHKTWPCPYTARGRWVGGVILTWQTAQYIHSPLWLLGDWLKKSWQGSLWAKTGALWGCTSHTQICPSGDVLHLTGWGEPSCLMEKCHLTWHFIFDLDFIKCTKKLCKCIVCVFWITDVYSFRVFQHFIENQTWEVYNWKMKQFVKAFMHIMQK